MQSQRYNVTPAQARAMRDALNELAADTARSPGALIAQKQIDRALELAGSAWGTLDDSIDYVHPVTSPTSEWAIGWAFARCQA